MKKSLTDKMIANYILQEVQGPDGPEYFMGYMLEKRIRKYIWEAMHDTARIDYILNMLDEMKTLVDKSVSQVKELR